MSALAFWKLHLALFWEATKVVEDRSRRGQLFINRRGGDPWLLMAEFLNRGVEALWLFLVAATTPRCGSI